MKYITNKTAKDFIKYLLDDGFIKERQYQESDYCVHVFKSQDKFNTTFKVYINNVKGLKPYVLVNFLEQFEDFDVNAYFESRLHNSAWIH